MGQGPRNRDRMHAMRGTADARARQGGDQIGLKLATIQMPPSALFTVIVERRGRTTDGGNTIGHLAIQLDTRSPLSPR